jgi:hypothetical protein
MLRSLAWPIGRQTIVLAAAACLGMFAWEAMSDEPPGAEPKLPMGLIDIARVFKEDRTFNAKMEEVKARIEEFERYVREQQAEIARLKPKDSSGGSGEASDAARRADALATALAAEITAKRQAFLAEEAVIYYGRYQAVEAAVAQVCRERRLEIVLRFNSDKMDPADRASVLQGVNRAVVYSTLPDLTGDVLTVLNESAP